MGEGFDIIRKTVLEFWESGAMPTGWESGLLAILPKGDLSNAGNYRGIMMLEVAYKIVANIMESRLDPIMESLDHEAQCGFRKKSGCAGDLHRAPAHREAARARPRDVDPIHRPGEAFDRVPRALLWKVLLKYGCRRSSSSCSSRCTSRSK